MSRFIRIIIFTLLIAAIVFFGFRALLSTSTQQATKNIQKSSESDGSLTKPSQAEQTDTPSAENNPEAVEASESETQTNETNKDDAGKDSNDRNKISAGENDNNKKKLK